VKIALILAKSVSATRSDGRWKAVHLADLYLKPGPAENPEDGFDATLGTDTNGGRLGRVGNANST
jgi:hypothetical protein